jgi:hypothetical protein
MLAMHDRKPLKADVALNLASVWSVENDRMTFFSGVITAWHLASVYSSDIDRIFTEKVLLVAMI